MQTTDTIGRVPRPRGVLSDETVEDLKYRKNRVELAQVSYRISVLAALDEGSFSAVAEATGLSKDTLQRWKRQAGR